MSNFSAAALCFNKSGKILLLRRRPDDRAHPDPNGKGKWCFPGGKSEVDEIPEETIARELFEETGLVAIRLDYIGPYHKIAMFEAYFDKEEVIISSEHIEARWFETNNLPGDEEIVGPATIAMLARHKMQWPLASIEKMMPDEPGEFGSVRSKDIHTGVDLYCNLGTPVIAMEAGTVVGIEPFTGPSVMGKDSTPWWNDTVIILIQNKSGRVIGYGEVGPDTIQVKVGDSVYSGTKIGEITVPVLRSFKGRPMTMLHLECYNSMPNPYTNGVDTSATVWWNLGDEKPSRLEDPTELLKPMSDSKFDLAKYDGVFSVDPNAPRKESHWWSFWGGKP